MHMLRMSDVLGTFKSAPRQVLHGSDSKRHVLVQYLDFHGHSLEIFPFCACVTNKESTLVSLITSILAVHLMYNN